MTRLHDRIRANGFDAPPHLAPQDVWEWRTKITPPILASLPLAQVMHIGNVSRYFFEGNDQEEWEVARDFPNIAPPFPIFWMEYPSPKTVVSAIGVTRWEHPATGFGFLFVAAPADADPPHPLRKKFFSHVDDPAWFMDVVCFAEIDRRIVQITMWTFAIDQAGRRLDHVQGVIGQMNDYRRQHVHTADLLLYPALLALSFLHCKNVSLDAIDPPAKVARNFQRKHGIAPVRYHILNIEPMKQVLKHEGQSEKTGLKRALHICRGHFKDYTERGLFGKYKGVYWWESRVRGSADEGVVKKDYNIKTPSKSA